MKTRIAWCEDCRCEVTIYGDYLLGTREFEEVDRDGHDNHDLSSAPPPPTRADRWSITEDGPDSQGREIVMVRLDGKPYTRAYSMSEARHRLREYVR